MNRFRYIDLFAGIGGFHQALSSFGGQCVFASEWDRPAAKVYVDNYQIEPQGDITKIKEQDIPEQDILCAGFPCQAFSISGKQRGFGDPRGNLFFDIVRIAQFHQPKVLLLENVRNFARHDHGNTLNRVLQELDKIGYRVHYKVLNAADFGLPQNRERIFFVGIHRSIGKADFHFPKPTGKICSLDEILESQPKGVKEVKRADTYFTRENYQPELSLSGESILPHRPIQIGYVNKGGQGERIYSTYGHAVTLSAYGGGIGSKTGLYLVNGVIRKLSPRECARIQGFPESFILPEAPTQAYKQFGNSVAVNVVKAIFQKILDHLEIAKNNDIKNEAHKCTVEEGILPN